MSTTHPKNGKLRKIGIGRIPDPVQVRHPESNHTSNEAPKLPALRLTRDGALNIPDPICRPITSETPCQYVTALVFLSGSSSSRSDAGDSGRACVEELQGVLEDSEERDRRDEARESTEERGTWDIGGGVSLV